MQRFLVCTLLSSVYDGADLLRELLDANLTTGGYTEQTEHGAYRGQEGIVEGSSAKFSTIVRESELEQALSCIDQLHPHRIPLVIHSPIFVNRRFASWQDETIERVATRSLIQFADLPEMLELGQVG